MPEDEAACAKALLQRIKELTGSREYLEYRGLGGSWHTEGLKRQAVSNRARCEDFGFYKCNEKALKQRLIEV